MGKKTKRQMKEWMKLQSWFKSFESYLDKKFDVYVKENKIEQIISNGFSWEKSKEGIRFWMNVRDEFEEYMYNN